MLWRKFLVLLVCLLALANLSGCALGVSDEVKVITPGARPKSSIDPSFEPLPPAPPADTEEIRLGAELFRERRLSADNTVSCASCHQLNRAGADGRRLPIGIHGTAGQANTPSIFNSVLNFRQFWDGRAASLAEQLNGPLTSEIEMGSRWEDVIRKLNSDPAYAKKFRSVFGSPATKQNITKAITAFEATLLTPNAPFDRFLRGENGALTASQLRGYQNFRSYGCVACHQGVNLGGNMYQTLGVMGDYFKERGGKLASDEGLFTTTRNPADMHVFRVPGLRNVELTAPYLHDGNAPTLEAAVRTMAKYQLGRSLTKDEVNDIVSFLKSLTGETPASLKGGGKP